MTAHQYLLEHVPAVGEEAELDGDEGHHAATVKRTRVGEEILLADGSGRRAVAVVVEVTPGRVRALVRSIAEVTRPGPRLVLVQALAKGGRDEQAVEAATELGVDEIVAWQARRSVVRWRGERGARSLRKWEDLARAASKQSRRADVPTIAGPADLGALAERVRAAALTLVLDGEGACPLSGMELPAGGEILVVVGPEGGIEAGEREALVEAGARVVRLGPEVLRASSAGPAALAVLNSARRWR